MPQANPPPPNPQPHSITLTAPGHFVFVLPPGVTTVELLSGHFVPQGDGRRLGACITSLALDGDPVALDRQMLAAGFHPIEESNETLSRWTDGRGVLTIPESAVERVLEIGVQHVIRSMDPDPA